MKNHDIEELKELLIIVDMVNGFIKEGNMHDKKIEDIIPEIKRLIKAFKETKEGVAFIKDTHEKGCREFNRYPIHCLRGTNESELVDELKPYEDASLVYEKNSTSTIFAPNFLNDINKMKNLKKVIITGCCTDICILNLALPLQNYFDEKNIDASIIIPKNAVETYHSLNHQREIMNQMAYSLLEQSGIQLVKKYERSNYNGK